MTSHKRMVDPRPKETKITNTVGSRPNKVIPFFLRMGRIEGGCEVEFSVAEMRGRRAPLSESFRDSVGDML